MTDGHRGKLDGAWVALFFAVPVVIMLFCAAMALVFLVN